MDLKEFITKTISGIVNGLSDASKEIGKDVYMIGAESTAHRHIEFDVAVSVEEMSGMNGGGKIKVLSFFEAGGEKSLETKNSTISRIKFGVLVQDNTSKNRASEVMTTSYE
jgi:hypothetical protein